MSSLLPPQPTGVPPDHAFWNTWYNQLRTLINGLANSIPWTTINFTGSKLTDILIRNHNDLQTIQGGTTNEYYHLTNAEHGQIGLLPLNSKSSDPTTSDIAASTAKLYKNTTSGTVKLWVNDAGTMKSVTLT